MANSSLGGSHGPFSPLCETCSRVVPFAVHETYPKRDPLDGVYGLGLVEEIESRAKNCDLCHLITERINSRSGANHGGLRQSRCRFRTYPWISLKSCTNEQPPADEIPDLKDQCVVEVLPKGFDGLLGPALPPDFFLPGVIVPDDRKFEQPWLLLSFRPSVRPVPSIEAFCDERWERLHAATSTVFSGRLRRADFDLRLPNRWLRICERYHGTACGPPAWAGGDGEIVRGLRVIDVRELCVVSAPSDCSYIALSYCWGSAVTLTATRATEGMLAMPGALKDDERLPKTVRDAIRVTDAIGKRYLWVDALCIVQDDAGMVAHQIPLMSQIYGMAAVTILATGGNDAGAGLEGVEPGSRDIVQNLILLDRVNLLEVVDDDNYEGVKQSVWNTRAWTMQERLFSRRQLIFTSKQVYWKCRCAYWMEEVALETTDGDVHIERQTGGQGMGLVQMPNITAESQLYIYCLLVSEYSNKEMSYATDSLNAFAGVMEALSRVSGEKFLWGIPESQFGWTLGWTVFHGVERHHQKSRQILHDGSVREVPFPSWSWSAWKHRVRNEYLEWPGEIDNETNRGKTRTVAFYRCSLNGELKAVNQIHGQLQPGDSDLAKLWVGQPLRVKPAEKNSTPDASFVDSGLLKFWTSVGKVYLHRQRMAITRLPIKHTALGADGEIISRSLSVCSNIAFRGQEASTESGYPLQVLAYKQREGGEGDVIALDGLVVSQVGEYLGVILVEWTDGIAHRVGFACLKESAWVKLKRSWELVTLG